LPRKKSLPAQKTWNGFPGLPVLPDRSANDNLKFVLQSNRVENIKMKSKTASAVMEKAGLATQRI
jgi:hypothetical protein